MSYRNGCVGLIVILAILIYIWGFLNNPTKGILRFQATGLNTHFVAKKYSSFDDYIHQTSLMVNKAHNQAHYHVSEKDIFNNLPKILLPNPLLCPRQSHLYEKGIVLIHGLFDSPYGMAQLGQFFQRHCFLVYVPLLSGHGTVVGDLLNVNYQDWINVVNFSAIELSKRVKHIYLGGHSIGGLLAINQALSTSQLDIQGLILLAPALAMKTQLTPLITPLYWVSRWVPRLQWWQLKSDSATVRYESVPINPVYQTLKLMQLVSYRLTHQKLHVPIFVLQSIEDQTVDSAATIQFFNSTQNPFSRLLVFSEEKQNSHLYDSRTSLFSSYLPKQNILSMSHLSLTLQMNDPIYGIKGIYKDCLYYEDNSIPWKQCKSGLNAKLGEVTNQNLQIAVIQRLTFNPFYNIMLNKLIDFLQI